jgi:hypothetical protein
MPTSVTLTDPVERRPDHLDACPRESGGMIN